MGVIIDEVVSEVESEERERSDPQSAAETRERSPQLEAARLASLLAHLESRRQRLMAD